MNNKRKPGSNYTDDDINQILNELSAYNQPGGIDSSAIGEMASRYGVDPALSEGESYASSTSGYAFDTNYNGHQTIKSRDEVPIVNGQRILYDADMEERKRKIENAKHTTNGVRVIYDADASSTTVSEAPYDDVSDVDPELENQINQQAKANKKAAKKTKRQEKRKEKRPANEDELTKVQKILKVFLPWTGDPKKEIVRKIIMDVSFCVLLASSLYMTNYFIDMRNTVSMTKDFVDTVNTDTPDNDDEWAKIKEKYPDIVFPEGMMIKFADLYAQNQDMAGFLSIENTNISTPIVQKSDDTENTYYLYRNFYKQDTKYGCPYLDYRNNLKPLDQNTVIYGHHMRDGLLFAQLEKYMTVDGYKESPIITFSTLYETYYFKVYTAIITAGNASQDNGYIFNYIVTNFLTDAIYQGYIDALNERALYTTGVGLTTSDKIITLSTCSYEYDGARLVVVGRLLREGESLDCDFSQIEVNENPRYPQKWYDVNGISNPFKDAENWDPANY